MRFALLVLSQRSFLHSLQAIVYPMLSQFQCVVFSLAFRCETSFIL
jgi:hypothetical protein